MAYDSTLERLPDPYTGGPGFVSQSIIDNSPGMVHNLNNDGSIAVRFSGSYWTINIGYPQLTIAESNTIIPFLYSLQGAFTNFYVQLPTYKQPATGAWQNQDVDGNWSGATHTLALGDKSNKVVVTGWDNITSANANNDLSVNDAVKFSGSNKIFLITNVSAYSAANVGTKTITLNTDAPTNIVAMALEPNEIKFRVRMQGAAPQLTITPDGLYEAFSLQLRENIQ